MALLNKKKDESLPSEELKILSTQIEAINQQLSNSGINTNINNNSNPEILIEINNKLNYLYQVIENLNKTISNTNNNPGNKNIDLKELNENFKKLVKIYLEESQIFRKQNDFLQERLASLETNVSILTSKIKKNQK